MNAKVNGLYSLGTLLGIFDYSKHVRYVSSETHTHMLVIVSVSQCPT